MGTDATPLRVFVSYRRDDSIAIAGRIRDHLSSAFGSDNVYFDVDTIPFGVDFRQHIDKMVADCDVVLVVIGRRYLEMTNEAGARRLDDPADFVRLEVEAALRRDIPVVPLLVDGASMPNEAQLPEGMTELAYRNGTAVRYDPDFHTDMDRLVNRLSPAGVRPAAPQPPTDRELAVEHIGRANALINVGSPDDALIEATEAIRLDPTSAEAYLVHGMARWNRGARVTSTEAEKIDQWEALKDYNESIRLDPNNGLVYHNRAMLFMARGDYELADPDIEMSKKLPWGDLPAPDSAEA